MSRIQTLLNAGKRKAFPAAALEPCLPFSIEPPGATEAVLLLHGFTGNPSEMRPVGEVLSSMGYAVHAPRYPGHGSTREDFYATDSSDWVRSAFDARMNLAARYETVHVVGHSMGGVIASAVASVFPTPRLILLSPAFKLAIPGANLTPFLAPFKKTLYTDKKPTAMDQTDPVRKALYEEYWKDDLIRPTASLVSLSRRARRNLRRVESKVLALLGGADPTVPTSVEKVLRKYLSRSASLRIETLPEAGHLFPFDGNAAVTAKIITDWMTAE